MSLEEDFDEDYVPKNHPLYAYMEEVGVGKGDFEPDNFCEPNFEESSTTDDISNNYNETPTQWKKLCNIFSDVKKIMKEIYLNRLLNQVQKSGILIEEDDRFLSFYFENNDYTANDINQHISFNRLKIIGLVGFVVLVVTSLFILATYSLHISTLIIGALVTLLCLPLSHTCHMLLSLRSVVSQIDGLVTSAANFDRLMRKSILFVQEMEVVARGFTFVSNQGVLSNLEATKKSHSERQCPVFRRQLFLQMRRYVHTLRWITRDVIKVFPDARTQDTIHCIAEMDVAEFGPSLSLSETSVNELSQITQNFAIALLKGMHQLTGFHISELLRKMCIIASIAETKTDLDSLQTRLLKWKALIAAQLDQCNRIYQQSRACSPPQQFQAATSPVLHSANTQERRLYTALHSLSLHLQSVLYRVRGLEDSLEAAPGPTPQLRTSLSGLKGELDACLVCWEESVRQTDPEGRKENSRDDGAVPLGSSPVVQQSTGSQRAEVWLLGDPIIEDQVLEAYVESDEESAGEADDWGPLGTAAEAREQRKQEKEQAKRMLGELQNVISTRARQWQKREKSALKRQQLNAGQTVSSSDEDSTTEQEGDDTVDNIVSGGDDGDDSSAPDTLTCQPSQPLEKEAMKPVAIDLSASEEAQLRQRVRQLPTGFQLELTTALAAQVVSRRTEMLSSGGEGLVVGGWPSGEECFGDDSSSGSGEAEL